MTRLFLCAAAQIIFVTLYGAWAMFRPEEAFEWMVPVVVVVLVLIVYNALEPIREAWQHRCGR